MHSFFPRTCRKHSLLEGQGILESRDHGVMSVSGNVRGPPVTDLGLGESKPLTGSRDRNAKRSVYGKQIVSPCAEHVHATLRYRALRDAVTRSVARTSSRVM